MHIIGHPQNIQKVKKKKLTGEIDKYTNIIGISDVSFSVSEI